MAEFCRILVSDRHFLLYEPTFQNGILGDAVEDLRGSFTLTRHDDEQGSFVYLNIIFGI